MPTSKVSFLTPEAAEEQSISRRRSLAEAMQKSALEPIQAQSFNGIPSPISWTQGLAKLLQGYQGGQAMRQADEQARALATQGDQRRQADMSMLAQALSGRQAQPGGLSEDASGNVTQMDPMPAQSPVQSIGQAIPMMSSGMQPMAMQALMGAQQREDTQRFQAGEAEQNRMARMQERMLALQAAEAQAGSNRELQATLARERMALQQQIADAGNQMRRDVAGMQATSAAERQQEKAEEGRKKVFDQDQMMLSNMESSMDRLSTAANELMRHPGLGGITGIRGAFPNIPGGQAADAQAKLQTLKAQVGFGVLQEMRNASKSGGALGSVTEKELTFLQNALAALDNAQSVDQFQESLQKIMDYAAGAKGRMRNAFTTKHSGREGVQPYSGPERRAPTQLPQGVTVRRVGS